MAASLLAFRRVAVPVTLLFLLLAGCTTEDPASPSGEPSIRPSGGSQPDWEALYEQEVEQLALEFQQHNGVPPPDDVKFVRFVDLTEYGEVHAACVREQGFGARATFDGGTVFDRVPESQGLALNEAVYRCDIAYPVHPRYSLPLTEAQIRTTYEYYVNELVPCLAARGYSVEPAPSWETFLATQDTGAQWVPYDAVHYTNEAEWQRINQACPQSPPLEDLFGGDG